MRRWIAALAASCCALVAQANVLVIVADDLGVDSLGCYQEGADLPATPNLDALAAGGILFRNAYAYPSCSPTRAAVLSGRHPCRTLVGRWIRHELNTAPAVGTLRDAELTLPEVLDRAATGHAHACIGKWHVHDNTWPLQSPVTHAGFDHFTGFLAGELPNYFAWPRVSGTVEQTCNVYATTQQTNDALAWITSRTSPWFCLLTYNAPHLPFHAPPASLHNRTITATTSNRVKYLAAIEALDHEIGRLFTTIGPAVLANTHVLFLGDNGSIQNMAVAPFLGGRAKGTPYEGGINVPLLYKGPAAVQPGRQVQALACAVDVFATVVDLLGAASAVPDWLAVDGVSFVPLLASATAPPVRAFAFSEEFTGNAWPAPNTNGHAIVRDDRYKLIHRYGGGSHELFDLQNDPWEQSNLLAAPLTPAQLQRYNALLAEVARLRTPLARCTPFGSGCAGSAGTPAVACSAPPRLGTTIQLEVNGAPPSVFVVAAIGWSHTEQGGVTLPLSLTPFGSGPGCTQWFRLDATFATITTAAGSAAMSLAIPNTASLAELTLFHGGFVLDAMAPNNPLGIVTTNAQAVVLGL